MIGTLLTLACLLTVPALLIGGFNGLSLIGTLAASTALVLITLRATTHHHTKENHPMISFTQTLHAGDACRGTPEQVADEARSLARQIAKAVSS